MRSRGDAKSRRQLKRPGSQEPGRFSFESPVAGLHLASVVSKSSQRVRGQSRNPELGKVETGDLLALCRVNNLDSESDRIADIYLFRIPYLALHGEDERACRLVREQGGTPP